MFPIALCSGQGPFLFFFFCSHLWNLPNLWRFVPYSRGWNTPKVWLMNPEHGQDLNALNILGDCYSRVVGCNFHLSIQIAVVCGKTMANSHRQTPHHCHYHCHGYSYKLLILFYPFNSSQTNQNHHQYPYKFHCLKTALHPPPPFCCRQVADRTTTTVSKLNKI